MKKITAVLITIAMISGIVLASGLGTTTKRFEIQPNSLNFTKITYGINKRVQVSARANQGKVYIEVYNPKGRKVASGLKRVSFSTKNQKGKYKFSFKNQTSKIQKVVASFSFGAEREMK